MIAATKSADPTILDDLGAKQEMPNGQGWVPARARPPKPPKQPLPAGAAMVVQVLLTLAAMALWIVGYLVVIAPVQQDRAQQVLYSQFREEVAKATAPIGGMVPPGAPVAVLDIPGLALRQVVVEGTASAELMNGPGHRRDTPMPGQAGVSIVYGRGGTFGGPFGGLVALRKGDRVVAVTGQGSFEYRVDGVRRTGDPVPQALAQGAGRLTMVTAEGKGRFAEISRGETVYVDASLLDEAVPAPQGRPNLIPPVERAMAVDPDGLVPLVLWLQALALGMSGFVWARARWGRWQTWMVGAPVILALTWRSTEAAALLLPNLM